MANSNLTPERKAILKKEILEEIGKVEKVTPKKKAVVKAVKKVVNNKPKPQLPEVKKVVPKPIIEKTIKKEEIKKELNKIVAKKEQKEPIKKVPAKTKPISVKKKVVKKKVIKKKPTIKRVVKKKKPIEDIAKVEIKPKVKPVITHKREFIPRPALIAETIKSKGIYKPELPLKSKKMFILGVIVFIIITIITFLAINILGIYKFGFDGQTSQMIVRVLPLPAGKVDGNSIAMSDYLNDLKTVKKILSDAPEGEIPTDEELKTQLFERLISMKIISAELEKYNLAVSDELLEVETQKVIQQIGSEEKARDDIQRLYGMDLEMFQKNVLLPLIAMDLLQGAITHDDDLGVNKEAREKADLALQMAIVPGVDFQALSIQYTNDPTIANLGGDIGWFVRGELPEEIENVLFALDGDTVYDQVVVSDYGYLIFKVEEKLTDKETGKESIKLSQIFIKVDIDLYIKSLFDGAEIKKYIK